MAGLSEVSVQILNHQNTSVPTQWEERALESPASALRNRFEQLFDSTDAADRGRRFEKLIRGRLALEGFHVELNPKIAAPRQTDLFTRLGTTDYFIEAKWQSDKIGIADIDNIRIRLQRMPTDVVACIFSMSDYSQQAIDQVGQDRTREILLFNAAEINAIFQQRAEVAELLRGNATRCESMPMSSSPMHPAR
jgi:hypothetical protein